jgi:hypothetical protein
MLVVLPEYLFEKSSPAEAVPDPWHNAPDLNLCMTWKLACKVAST